MELSLSDIIIDPEFKALIPPLSSSERRDLEANLLADGCLSPLAVWQDHNVLLDGHNRHEICGQHKIPCKVHEIALKTRQDAKAWIIKHQLGRRNLKESQRAMLAATLKEMFAAGAVERQAARGIAWHRLQKIRPRAIVGVAHASANTVALVQQQAHHPAAEKTRGSRDGHHATPWNWGHDLFLPLFGCEVLDAAKRSQERNCQGPGRAHPVAPQLGRCRRLQGNVGKPAWRPNSKASSEFAARRCTPWRIVCEPGTPLQHSASTSCLARTTQHR